MDKLLNILWKPRWEGSSGRMDTCTCMAESLSCSLKLSQHCYLALSQYNRKRRNTQKTGFKSLYTPSSPNHPCPCSLKWKSLSRVWLCTSIRSAKLFCPWNSPGKNTGVGTHSLLQGSFQTLGLNLALLHCGQMFFTIWVSREVPAMFSVSANSVRINLLEPGNCKISLATPFKTLSRFNQLYCFPINIPICYPLLSIYIDKPSFFSFFFLRSIPC